MATERIRRGTRAAPALVTAEERVSVTISDIKGSAGTTKDKVLSVKKFVTEPAYIRVGAGVTKSTGNYESLRVDVSVSMPCYVEEIEARYSEVSDFVAECLDNEINAYLGVEE